MNAAFLVGRLVFGGFFAYNGVNHIRNHAGMAQYAGSKGVPSPEAAVIGSGALLLFGGASIVLGWKPKLGAAAILAFLAGVSPVMHNFWEGEDAGQKQNDMIHFSKNMALAGAAVALGAVPEPWPVSVGGSGSAVTGRDVSARG